MSYLLTFKKPLIWVKRFRKRCGYGVHSPFAFDFITTVIYEKTPYYAYSEIKKVKKYKPDSEANTDKVNRLLFRLVNRMQPATILTTSNSSSALYMQSAKKNAALHVLDNSRHDFPKEITAIDFLYLHNYKDPEQIEGFFNNSLKYTHGKSVFVIKGIHYSGKMKKLWKRLVEDEDTGITFDLYDLGIIFFDKTRLKQHYVVNF